MSTLGHLQFSARGNPSKHPHQCRGFLQAQDCGQPRARHAGAASPKQGGRMLQSVGSSVSTSNAYNRLITRLNAMLGARDSKSPSASQGQQQEGCSGESCTHPSHQELHFPALQHQEHPLQDAWPALSIGPEPVQSQHQEVGAQVGWVCTPQHRRRCCKGRGCRSSGIYPTMRADGLFISGWKRFCWGENANSHPTERCESVPDLPKRSEHSR